MFQSALQSIQTGAHPYVCVCVSQELEKRISEYDLCVAEKKPDEITKVWGHTHIPVTHTYTQLSYESYDKLPA